MYFYHEIEITNNGRVDASGSNTLLFSTDLEIDKIYLRMFRSSNYEQISYQLDSSRNMNYTMLGSIQGEKF